LLLDDQGHFRRCYFSFDASKLGFLAGCRPIIFLDGCHLKTKFGGVLLTAIGIDPNDCIIPVAMAVVEVEDTSSWRWFLTALKQDLGIVNTSPWTIMSDKQKVSHFVHFSMNFVLTLIMFPIIDVFSELCLPINHVFSAFCRV
jgi:hypothetical protein